MVIIAINNIPPKLNLKKLVKILAPIIQGHFEALNFHGKKGNKTAYIRLADTLPVRDVINRIHAKSNKIGRNQVNAFIPDSIPDLPLSHKPRIIPTKMRRKLHIPLNITAKELLSKSVDNIVKEMQTKYTGLYRLSETTKHQLLETIGRIVYQRLKHIVDNPDLPTESCFQLTKTYRQRYPHNTDFQFIVQTVHSVQDAQGKPRTNPDEKRMTSVQLGTGGFSDLPYDLVEQLSNSHIARISQKLDLRALKCKPVLTVVFVAASGSCEGFGSEGRDVNARGSRDNEGPKTLEECSALSTRYGAPSDHGRVDTCER
ncbi:uncharacterized protein [Maniola hyperantus]|uniref:uncharacterized protein isoform X2 n=1 Tax=Aphantopus hyperantus TaxID=2795564 RepID=UPI0037482C3B